MNVLFDPWRIPCGDEGVEENPPIEEMGVVGRDLEGLKTDCADIRGLDTDGVKVKALRVLLDVGLGVWCLRADSDCRRSIARRRLSFVLPERL